MKSLHLLKGFVVADMSAGMASALMVKLLTEMGAKVIRMEPLAGDPFRSMYPAYDIWLKDAEIDKEALKSAESLDVLLTNVDICITGGESHPQLSERSDGRGIAERHPHLVVLDIEGYPEGSGDEGRPATDLLLQARSGFVYEHFSDRPVVMSFYPSAYGTAFRGLTALLAAVYEREGSGKGQLVSTSLYEGTLTWLGNLWFDIERSTPALEFVMPKDPYPTIFRCADDIWVHFVIGSAGSKYKIYRALKIDDPTVKPEDSGMPTPTDNPKNFFGDIDLLAAHAIKIPSGELLERIWAEGLPAAPILPPGGCWDEDQVRHNGVIETNDDGYRYVGCPFSATSRESSYKKKSSRGDRPLDGVRVIDFGSFVAGPYGAAILADLGADVIKVETLAGDPNANIFISYASVNHGKRAVAIDLKSEDGLRIARDLCLSADVVMNNFRPGVSARLGIDPTTLHKLKPELIVLESPGYGLTGPLATRAAFDPAIQALTGHEYRFGGGAEGMPLWSRTNVTDYTAGWLGAVGLIASLVYRERTGHGVFLCNPLLNAGVFLNSGVIQTPDGVYAGAEPLNSTLTGFIPAEALYKATDGWVAICVRNTEAANALIKTLNLGEDLDEDYRLWGEEEQNRIAEAIREFSVSEVSTALEKSGVWVEKCREDGRKTILREPNILRVYQHPDHGQVTELGAMVRFSRSNINTEKHSPCHGEHTREVLAELGLSGEKVDALYDRKIIA